MLVATILTYHRIVPDGSREQFHDIEATAFVRQLRRVVERTVTDGRSRFPARRVDRSVSLSMTAPRITVARPISFRCMA